VASLALGGWGGEEQEPVLKIILDFQCAVFVTLQSLTLLFLLRQPIFILKLCSTVMGVIL